MPWHLGPLGDGGASPGVRAPLSKYRFCRSTNLWLYMVIYMDIIIISICYIIYGNISIIIFPLCVFFVGGHIWIIYGYIWFF
jgi:hypothetical protein